MAYTQADLDALDRAIASGELTVQTSSGNRVTYRSVEELLRARGAVKAALDEAAGAARSPIRRYARGRSGR